MAQTYRFMLLDLMVYQQISIGVSKVLYHVIAFLTFEIRHWELEEKRHSHIQTCTYIKRDFSLNSLVVLSQIEDAKNCFALFMISSN